MLRCASRLPRSGCHYHLARAQRTSAAWRVPALQHCFASDAAVVKKAFAPFDPKKPNFDDTVQAFAHMSTPELIRALAVLKLCSVRFIVKHADSLLSIGKSVLGEKLVLAIVKKTFFAHFCAGETAEEAQPVVARLRESNIHGIMDYAAEADVSTVDQTARLHDMALRRQEGVVAARTYLYSDEVQCDENMELMLQSVEGAAKMGDNEFVAIKLTAIAKPELLEKISTVLRSIRLLWINEFGSETPTHELDFDRFYAFIGSLGVLQSESEARALFDRMDLDRNGLVDYIEWTRLLSFDSADTRVFFQSKGYNMMLFQPLADAGSLPLLDESEMELAQRFRERLATICARAAERGVNLMIDAEQTYMQPAIDHFARVMQQEHNREVPVVYNTYQAYLKTAKRHLFNDLQRAKRLGFCFAGKLVRGAYLVGERARARDIGEPSPIWDSLEETHMSYDACIEIVLRERDSAQSAAIMVASHNRRSIETTTALMNELDVPRAGGNVYFGQLLGMSDRLSFPLGRAGYEVYKYIPYGPVAEVVPYLVRRAQENGDVLSNARLERRLMWRELVRRVVPFGVVHSSSSSSPAS